jgi:DNA-binding SARP family transcriptional activator
MGIAEIDVRLLGPLEVELSSEYVRFEGVKQRRLFVLLALRAPEAVSADELVEALWGREPPAGAVQALQKQVSRLRRRLGEGLQVRHRPAGYALEIDPWAIDFRRFEDLLERARVALGRDDPEHAADDLRAALALWRGRRWPITAPTSSHSVRSSVWRKCGWRRSRSGWWRSWPADGTRISSVS